MIKRADQKLNAANTNSPLTLPPSFVSTLSTKATPAATKYRYLEIHNQLPLVCIYYALTLTHYNHINKRNTISKLQIEQLFIYILTPSLLTTSLGTQIMLPTNSGTSCTPAWPRSSWYAPASVFSCQSSALNISGVHIQYVV